MKLTGKILLSAMALAATFTQMSAISIVPKPSRMMENRSIVHLPSDRLKVHASEKDLKQTALVWAESMKKTCNPGTVQLETGFTQIVSDVRLPEITVTGKAKGADIRLSIDSSLSEEGYTLEISQQGVAIKGGSVTGVWWGLQSLTQILVQAAPTSDGRCMAVSGLYIEDQPHFAYRSAMLDCCRHFFSVDEVKKYIDIIALHKLNTLHWHLTEDQGWRIEIKKYPLLTEIGSVRPETKIGLYGDKSTGYDGTPYGGYYTQDQVREIVRYAAERQITVIPEIEMPGHAVAALASYPWLGCTGKDYTVRTDWGISKDVFCIGRESTFEFLENVLDEVCELFPSEYIHIGGDEAPSVRWTTCPDCQKRMKEEGLTAERELQGYLLKRIESYLNAKGKKIIGWDEILEGGVTRTATVMSWRGPQGGITAAKQGNNVIMSPNNYFYLDYYQTAAPKENGEPLGIGGYVPLSKCYSFDPYDQLDEETRQHIKGIQANTWTEYIKTFDHVQFMDLPRFAALSEVSWSESKDSYDEFLSRVTASMKPLYEYFGFIYAPYAFNGVR